MTDKWRNPADSPNYRDGKFHNLTFTPMMAEDASILKVLGQNLNRPKTNKPSKPLPSVRTDLRALHSDTPAIVWFGHSSYLINYKNINILIDPVFSGHASPISGLVKAYPGADVYKPDDMPDIDLLILTHNHYDHFDTGTIKKLSHRIRSVILPLGVGPLAASCGIDRSRITELDWWESTSPLPGIQLTATPARHFSGRGLTRGKSLWVSYVLNLDRSFDQTPNARPAFAPPFTIFLGGDSGYEEHFKAIAEKFAPFDLSILECGQYNHAWRYIHMMPEQTARAAVELEAKLLLPVHWAKFSLSVHPWTEPIERVTKAAAQLGMPIATPLIGQPLTLGQPIPQTVWWKQKD